MDRALRYATGASGLIWEAWLPGRNVKEVMVVLRLWLLSEELVGVRCAEGRIAGSAQISLGLWAFELVQFSENFPLDAITQQRRWLQV